MEWQLLITDFFVRIAEELECVLNGLTMDELNQMPNSDGNSIGWLAWHLTRSHDRNLSELAGKEQHWIKDKCGTLDLTVPLTRQRRGLVIVRKI